MRIFMHFIIKNTADLPDDFIKGLDRYILENYSPEPDNLEYLRSQCDIPECLITASNRKVIYGSTPFSELDKYKDEKWKKSLEEKTFSSNLKRLIKEKNKINTEVYKKALLDRKHFSKIMLNNDYCPSKNTAISLAIALELTLEETQEFLSSAGYALSESKLTDIIVSYFIKKERYNIHEINETLVDFKLKPLQD